ncbi:MAG: hypothetical protein JO076_05150, partial [Verrucomicrobia bacterium]|nr:hypothetical protein [Verrucomicrobiota bacterium]
MKLDRVEELVSRFPSKRILVIGDLMLDEFVWGRVSRISPEAPVPVVEVLRESFYPGGAANVARNVREFSPSVYVMGLVGKDSHAVKLRTLLEENGIRLDALESEAASQTIVKTRIIARQQQVVRVDREKPSALSLEVQQRCFEKLTSLMSVLDAIIFEDYGKGFLQQEFVDRASNMARAQSRVVTADPNPRNPLSWHGLTAIKPNRGEAFAAAGKPLREPEADPAHDEALLEVGQELLRRWKPESLLVTLGEQGMILFSEDRTPYHVPSRAQEVYDVSGAGDTAIAL